MKSNTILLITLLSTGFSSNVVFSAPSSAKILVFGDFGTGSEDQDLVARDMANFCRAKGCDFAITTGDNIYPRGVENIKNNKVDYDNGEPNYKIISDIFVKKYKSMNMPFYMTYGNHDVGNEGIVSIFKDLVRSDSYIRKRTIALMNNQVNFTRHRDNPSFIDGEGRSARLWNFPNPFYRVEERGSTFLYSIDSNTFPDQALNNKNDALNARENNNEQASWLASSLGKQPQGWSMVFGHMPLYSHGRHGYLEGLKIRSFRKSIIDTLCANKVDFYLGGHDHHLEVDKHECENGHVIIAIVSGAAAKRDRIYKKAFIPLVSDKNLIWGNGRFYKGDKSIFQSDDQVLGFSYIDILDNNKARLIMKQSISAKDRSDGCFEITKGKTIVKMSCP